MIYHANYIANSCNTVVTRLHMFREDFYILLQENKFSLYICYSFMIIYPDYTILFKIISVSYKISIISSISLQYR